MRGTPAEQRTLSVKSPNAWGLYDMHGNVFEWCQDVWGGIYSDSDLGPVTDPKGLTGLDGYALRGGCWGSNANECRSDGGRGCAPDPRNNIVGFRVVVDRGSAGPRECRILSPSCKARPGKSESRRNAGAAFQNLRGQVVHSTLENVQSRHLKNVPTTFLYDVISSGFSGRKPSG